MKCWISANFRCAFHLESFRNMCWFASCSGQLSWVDLRTYEPNQNAYLFVWLNSNLVYSQWFQLDYGNDLIVPVVIAYTGLIAAGFACELGQRATDAFDGISVDLDKMNWYLLPNEAKRSLLIIIGVGQQPFFMDCFGKFRH